MRKTKSAILEVVHDAAKGLHQAGVMDQVTLREFDRRAFRVELTIRKRLGFVIDYMQSLS